MFSEAWWTVSSKVPLSLRERKKQGSMRRLKEAARELMWEKGYDEATTREIADRAEIGEATLFRYVASKLDLFMLVYGEDFEAVIDECAAVEAKLAAEGPTGEPQVYIDRIVNLYCRLAGLYVRYPSLAYTYVKESFSSETDIGLGGLAHGDRWYSLLESVIQKAQAAGAFLGSDVGVTAQNCHALYVHEVLRSHGRRLPAAGMPERLRWRLESMLEPMATRRSGF